MKPIFDSTIHEILNDRLAKLESHFSSDVIFYYSPIADSIEKPFRDFIEDLKADKVKHETLCIILNTPGGSAETVEKLVKITRHHYKEVYFIVPDYNDLICQYINRNDAEMYLHSRKFI